ncbi:MAG: helix-turn-helix domain-containing protein, partial [Planctomycetota bacterium]
MEVDSSEFFKWACTASVGQQINESRVAQQITQDELGEIAGCGGPHISKIEHGLMFPTGNTLARISAALGTPIVIGPEHGQISGGAANS